MKLLRFDILYILLQTFLPGDRKMKIFFLMSFLRLIAEAITPERKHFFFQMLSKLTKSMRNCQHPILLRNHKN